MELSPRGDMHVELARCFAHARGCSADAPPPPLPALTRLGVGLCSAQDTPLTTPVPVPACVSAPVPVSGQP